MSPLPKIFMNKSLKEDQQYIFADTVTVAAQSTSVARLSEIC